MNTSIYEKDFRFILSQKLPWQKLSGKTLLISGANGFLPSSIVETLLYFNLQRKKKVKIIGIVRNKEKALKRFAKYKNRLDLKLIFQDVSLPIKLKESVHFIIHAASQASPRYYNTDPVGTLTANVLGTYNLLELAREKKVESFLFISAGEIYGNMRADHRTTEKEFGTVDPTEVRSCYAESKRAGETMCVSWLHQYYIPAKIVRLYHTYGPGVNLDDGRVFADFVANILSNKNITMKSNGTAIRSFCYSADAIAGFLTILLKGKNGEAYNLANEKATVSIKKLAQILVGMYPKKNLKIVFKKRSKNDPYMKSTININYPSTDKLQKLGWRPHFSLEEGFRRMIEAYQRSIPKSLAKSV